jgi:class 3 adenylate cyclase/Tol biopolymer transport system component
VSPKPAIVVHNRGVDSVTAGFLFADLRGYTQFVETRGATAAVELLGRYRAIVREVIALYHGAEIKTEGDSFYVVFSVVSEAVDAGLEIQARSRSAAGGAIDVGIGVHAGEAVATPEGLVGSSVNVAARLCSIAKPGELLVSETVKSITAEVLDVRFDPRGRQRLKGVAEPVAIYAVTAGGSNAQPQRTRGQSGLLLAGGVVATVGVLAIAAVAIGLGLGGSAPAVTATPGQPNPTAVPSAASPLVGLGRVVFTAAKSGGASAPGESDIYIVNADGTDLQRIAHNDVGNELIARWSADGDSVLFMEHIDSNSQLRQMDADGSGARSVADLGLRLADDWSDRVQSFSVEPSGAQVAFGCPRTDVDSALCVVDLQTGQITMLTHGINRQTQGLADFSPAWTPHSDHLVFSRLLGASTVDWANELTDLTVADGTVVQLTSTAQDDEDWPVVSVDGRVVFVRVPTMTSRPGDLWTLSASGSSFKRLTDSTADDRTPSWSPDGDWVAFSSNDTPDHSYALFALPADGGAEKVEIASLPGYDLSAPDWGD